MTGEIPTSHVNGGHEEVMERSRKGHEEAADRGHVTVTPTSLIDVALCAPDNRGVIEAVRHVTVVR